ncbi:membrane fusion protein (multidrug efflux system) [Tamilnaduibacter salinus]|uniref:Membrane fusion protein (Multidrug efflux system) n=1 Tax=Tamilnaduibacter salinus TaxID=1484056 RepID=A0A2U1CW96_9GAMM|nr:efflux RND transporter periplasmic adaptor subunit [Tamilnaduibacter salinus]PVY75971.1 membrane fusion protein (multidrug efflux system) [Tamilnaduibacter salinus]
MRTASRFVIVIVVLAVVLGGIFGYKMYQFGQMKEMLSQPQPPAVIEATSAKQLSWTPSLKSVGSVTAINGVQIANEVPGVASDVRFESGDRVEQGDILVRLDSEVNEAALRTRRAEARLARQEFERVEDLLPRKAVSQSQYDEAEANLAAAQARVKEAEAQLAKKTLRAPFNGTLGLRLVDQGEYLPTGSPVVEINMLDPIYVDYTVSEKELSNIDVGHAVNVTVAAVPNEVFDGEISAINSSVSPESRTVRVRATIDNPNRVLRPGMFATVQTLRPESRNVVTVPRTAISFNTYGDFVFVVTENENGELITERRSVETGEVRDGRVEVKTNLKAGERVVATGLLRLRAGQRVEIKSENTDGSQDGGNSKEAGN